MAAEQRLVRRIQQQRQPMNGTLRGENAASEGVVLNPPAAMTGPIDEDERRCSARARAAGSEYSGGAMYDPKPTKTATRFQQGYP